MVPMTTGAITIDGEWDEPDWSKRALRGQFIGDDGQLARPSSEVRFLHNDRDLFVGLYAADDNIESKDAFDLTIGSLTLRADATGKVTPSPPGVRIAIDRDGSLDDPENFDEEWVIELEIPLTLVGLDHETAGVQASAARCDVPKGDSARCGQWSGAILLSHERLTHIE